MRRVSDERRIEKRVGMMKKWNQVLGREGGSPEMKTKTKKSIGENRS
jgi:hypothetical protein